MYRLRNQQTNWLLGIARERKNVFCGLTDISADFVKSNYQNIVEHLYAASKTMFESTCEKAVKEEKERNIEHE